jgi:cyclopropane fatty-acyl-phospholipid synthase-like methyltransferase
LSGERAPYDRIADRWALARTELLPREQRYFDRFVDALQPGAHVLDVGCGSGMPARALLDRGLKATGFDASMAMLRLARARCPQMHLVAADALRIPFRGPFDGIVAWDSLFHVPKAHHAQLFRALALLLAPGGVMLLSLGGSDSEFTAPMFGVEFFYSAHAPDRSVALLQQAGLAVQLWEVDDPSSRGHIAVLCRRCGD